MCRLLFLGDVYLNEKKISKNLIFSEEVLELFEQCDYVCYNLEGPLTDRKTNILKKGPAIKQDFNRIEQLNSAMGKNKVICDLANNHIMDYLEEGVLDTIQRMKGIHVGAGEKPYVPRIINCQNKSIGLLAVAEGGFGVAKDDGTIGYAWFLHECLSEIIFELKKRCEYVIVLSHAGLEGVKVPLPEIREIYKRFIVYGADIVIAHHPHMIQGVEQYNSKPIYYSLGNFMFDRLDGNGEYNGNSIGVLIEQNQKWNITIVPLEYKDGLVSFSDRSMVFFDEANRLLQTNDYDTYIGDKCINFYDQASKGYYKRVFGSTSKFYNLVKGILGYIGHDSFDENWLYHNLAIESNYWATLRGMELSRAGRKNKQDAI